MTGHVGFGYNGFFDQCTNFFQTAYTNTMVGHRDGSWWCQHSWSWNGGFPGWHTQNWCGYGNGRWAILGGRNCPLGDRGLGGDQPGNNVSCARERLETYPLDSLASPRAETFGGASLSDRPAPTSVDLSAGHTFLTRALPHFHRAYATIDNDRRVEGQRYEAPSAATTTAHCRLAYPLHPAESRAEPSWLSVRLRTVADGRKGGCRKRPRTRGVGTAALAGSAVAQLRIAGEPDLKLCLVRQVLVPVI